MAARFEELDHALTPIGEITLRRRTEHTLGVEVYEVKIDDEFLMSSLFTVVEVALARQGLAAHPGTTLDVLVGGLGLGYTAQAALADPRVRSLTVIEYVEAVIGWHQRDLLPATAGMAADERCHLVHDDFFDLVATERSERRYDVVLLDIDHSPENVLHERHQPFYGRDGLASLRSVLTDDGVFALWSDDPPDDAFLTELRSVFAEATSEVVPFDNPLTRGRSESTLYVARNLMR